MTLPTTPWSELELIERVEAGHRNEVWLGEIGGEPVAVRRSRRSAESLRWELDVIEVVARHGIGVAEVVETDDGRRSVDGVVVQRWTDGDAPVSTADWRLVAETLQRVHLVDVVQRPGASMVTELDRQSISVDADLAQVPDDVVAAALAVFDSLRDVPTGLIHGDPGSSNIRIDERERVWLLDWDESRVDLTWHDLSNLGVQVLNDVDHRRALVLSDAWETINAWTTEPEYARSRLAALRRALAD